MLNLTKYENLKKLDHKDKFIYQNMKFICLIAFLFIKTCYQKFGYQDRRFKAIFTRNLQKLISQ